jgi:hypothetical protein
LYSATLAILHCHPWSENVFSFASGNFALTALAVLFVNAYNGVEANQEKLQSVYQK